MGKSRLAPIKPVTIPRMKLSAAFVSTKLGKMARNELPINESFVWTDSILDCVLRHVENTSKRFQTFVANRNATIHDASSPTHWNYVDTHSNPADGASRGVPSNSLQRWIEGPDFLSKSPDEWPKRPEEIVLTTEDNDPEVKKSSFVCAADASTDGRHLAVEIVKGFPSLCRVKRVFAWILRDKGNLRLRAQLLKQDRTDSRTPSRIPPISLSELVNAETEILRHIQRASFKDELSCLQKTKTNNKISNTSCIVKLGPILKDGLIHVKGRLHQAQIDDDARHPIILPKNHHVVDLITKFYHHISGHSGLEHTLSLIRRAEILGNQGKTYSTKGIEQLC